jgi:hypothetical protein
MVRAAWGSALYQELNEAEATGIRPPRRGPMALEAEASTASPASEPKAGQTMHTTKWPQIRPAHPPQNSGVADIWTLREERLMARQISVRNRSACFGPAGPGRTGIELDQRS